MASIEIADFAPEGVTLTPATAPDFDSRAAAILGAGAPPALELKPYLAIVRNQNPRTVVAYTVAWTATVRNGTTRVKYTQFKFPDAVAGTSNGLSLLEGREIGAGAERLIGLGFEIWPPEHADSYRNYGLAEAFDLGSVIRLHIALDAVIFDDGSLLGPDRFLLAQHFIEFVRAKQSAYRDIVVALESDGLGEDALAPFRAIVRTPPAALPSDPFAIYPHLAAQEVLGFHRRVLLEVFRRTLRRRPFTIRRLSETSD